MKMFHFFRKNNSENDIQTKNVEGVSGNYDFSEIRNDNDVDKLIKSKKLVWIYIMSPMFGGAEERGNQIVVTFEAAKEKQLVDEMFKNLLMQGKSVEKLNINFEYKENSVVTSKIIISAIVDGNDFKKIIEVW